jgi:hypothetical protein
VRGRRDARRTWSCMAVVVGLVGGLVCLLLVERVEVGLLSALSEIVC